MWLAFTVKQPGREALAGRLLADAGYRIAIPEETYSYRQRWGRRLWVTAKRIAIPGYVFLAIPIAADPADVITQARAVACCLGRPVAVGSRPLLIPADWLDRLILDRQGLMEPAYRPVRGDVVKLNAIAGVLDGYRGRVESVSDRKVRVIVDALHRALAMTVPLHAVTRAA